MGPELWLVEGQLSSPHPHPDWRKTPLSNLPNALWVMRSSSLAEGKRQYSSPVSALGIHSSILSLGWSSPQHCVVSSHIHWAFLRQIYEKHPPTPTASWISPESSQCVSLSSPALFPVNSSCLGFPTLPAMSPQFRQPVRLCLSLHSMYYGLETLSRQ